VTEGGTGAEPDLPAGDFSAWLADVQGAIRGERGSEVPCGGCTACCTSSQFVHIGPDETGTFAAIPRKLLFPAPGAPPGHVLLGYDERGHCPMLVDGACSIYADRPRTCRTYDCRVFPAAGIDAAEGDPGKELNDHTPFVNNNFVFYWRAIDGVADQGDEQQSNDCASRIQLHCLPHVY
jgi:Fe-S-cluster containining protein